MGARVVVIVIAIGMTVGCKATGTFACASDGQCGANGLCEPAGFCSFPDPDCTSGRRYDEYAGGGLANVCVGEEPLVDAGPCEWPFTATNIDPCAVGGVHPTFHPQSGASYDYDTDDDQWTQEELPIAGPSGMMVAQSGGPTVRVLNLAGLELENNTTIQITGNLPLVIVVQGNAAIGAALEVQSGAAPPSLCMPATIGTNAAGGGAGGGGGGGFGAAGASGGTGGGGLVGGMAGGVAGNSTLTPLRGGCDGARGGNPVGTSNSNGGRGGGALQIIVKGTLSITGRIDAGGQQADGGLGSSTGAGGGGGGGAGGAIFLEADSLKLETSARVCANGASGGEGGSDTVAGASGSDATCSATTGATGGNALANAGDGGRGGFAATAAGFGGNAMTNLFAGGGGGGGVGRIRFRGVASQSVASGAIVSPPAP